MTACFVFCVQDVNEGELSDEQKAMAELMRKSRSTLKVSGGSCDRGGKVWQSELVMAQLAAQERSAAAGPRPHCTARPPRPLSPTTAEQCWRCAL